MGSFNAKHTSILCPIFDGVNRTRHHAALFILAKEALKEYRKQTTSNWRTALITRKCREPSHEFKEVSPGLDDFFKPKDGLAQHVVHLVLEASKKR